MEENKIPTYEDFLDEYIKKYGYSRSISLYPELRKEVAIEFAKMHVKKALEEADNNITIARDHNRQDHILILPSFKKSILENIK